MKNQPYPQIDDPAVDAFVWRIPSPSPRNTEEHTHDKGQIFSLESGLAIVETSAGSWMPPPHRCGWIPPNHRHALRSCGDISGWSIYLASSLCDNLPAQPTILSRSELLLQIILRLSEWEKKPPTAGVREHLLSVLCDELQAAEHQPLHLPMPHDPRLKRFVLLLSQQPEHGRTLKTWARLVGMSERSLLRSFRLETGMSIGQWRQHFRILIALEKLSSGVSVSDLCFGVGYQSAGAFSKAFKQIIGMTPLEYSQRFKRQASRPQQL